MGKRLAWLSLLVPMVVSCKEDLTAPGSCPDFCPSTLITVIDTIVLGSIVRDSSFRGYVRPNRASTLQVSRDQAGLLSRAVVRFLPLSERIVLVAGDTVGEPIVAVDSFRLEIVIDRFPELAGLEIGLHRLPASVDTLVTLSEVEPFFDDSTLIGTIPLPDTLEAGDPVSATLASDAFPTLDQDERVAAVGVTLRAPSAGFVNVRAIRGGGGATLTRFMKVDSAGAEVVERSEARVAELNSVVFPSPPDPVDDELAVGGAPSSRSILRVDLPSSIVDSATVVRATLILVPSRPVIGAPVDSITVQTEPLAADFGPKSPIIATAVPGLGAAKVAVGATDTVRIDISHIVDRWSRDPSAPRSFMIRVAPEAAGMGEFRFNSSRMPTGAPSLHLTYIPLAPQ